MLPTGNRERGAISWASPTGARPRCGSVLLVFTPFLAARNRKEKPGMRTVIRKSYSMGRFFSWWSARRRAGIITQ